jgi:hypothetical protein
MSGLEGACTISLIAKERNLAGNTCNDDDDDE